MFDMKAASEEASREGFARLALIQAKDIVCQKGLRTFCEENRCGQFGRNHSCPPACGTEEEMAERLTRYEKALLLVNTFEVKNALDAGETTPLKKRHSQKSRRLISQLEAEGKLPEGGLMILAGPCSFCSRCTLPEGKPCAYPKEQASCLSAYSINVMKLTETAGFELSWDLSQVTFVALYLF